MNFKAGNLITFLRSMLLHLRICPITNELMPEMQIQTNGIISSVESQKGINAVQWCSIEN